MCDHKNISVFVKKPSLICTSVKCIIKEEICLAEGRPNQEKCSKKLRW